MYYVSLQQQTMSVSPQMSQEDCAWALIHDEAKLTEDQKGFLNIFKEEIVSVFFSLKWSYGKWENNLEAAKTAKVALKRKHSTTESLPSCHSLLQSSDDIDKGTSNLEFPLTSVLTEVRSEIIRPLYRGLRKQMENSAGRQFVIKIAELAKLTLLTKGQEIEVQNIGKGHRSMGWSPVTIYNMPASEKRIQRAKIVPQTELSDSSSDNYSKIRSSPENFKSHVEADVAVTIPSKGTCFHILLVKVKKSVVANSQNEVQLLNLCFGAMTFQTEVYGLLIWTTGARLYQVSKHPEELPRRCIHVKKCEYIFNHASPEKNASQLYALFKDIVLVMQRAEWKRNELMQNLDAECAVEDD